VNSIGCSRHGHGLFSSQKPTHDFLYVDPSHSCTTQIMQDVLGGVTVIFGCRYRAIYVTEQEVQCGSI